VNATTLLTNLLDRGIRLSASGERLNVDAPKGAMTPDLRAALVEHKAGLLRLLNAQDAEIQWRTEVMRRQVRPGPYIPFLVARRDFLDAPSHCLSCGDPCGPGRRYRCGPCVRAAEIVVNEAWEGRHRQRAGALEEQHHDQ
jgi:hypothetical protein